MFGFSEMEEQIFSSVREFEFWAEILKQKILKIKIKEIKENKDDFFFIL